ncbi:hypothetical protein GOBAR_AA35899 [Gossypium barbadense]|uniref:Uncharacterized protein n=1 Tax=Gossypium barbadense TaxID=3634 RepID=A0A2P5W154_GOSBA|nr:hypothetical protein GOBAR_AA35899 [Gossypium barbadense]
MATQLEKLEHDDSTWKLEQLAYPYVHSSPFPVRLMVTVRHLLICITLPAHHSVPNLSAFPARQVANLQFAS